MQLAAGARLGPYEIVTPLGAGGMGEVYKAHDARLERVVAIKILPANKVADPARKQRFIQEARAASALNHPNIVTIHDISSESGLDFLVMEYVPGKTLEHVVPRKGLSLGDALKYAVQIADALAAANSAGIVHRDIKPSNIMVTDHGRVKVLDFGLAKLTDPPEIGPDQPTRTVLANTEEGTVVGSAPYMSPEQAQGKPVDARSDIFSFGAVLYEMVTGQKAFHGDTRASVMASILKDEPKSARALTEALPRELERIILRCLRKDLERRSQSMAEIKLALEELKEESESGALPAAAPAAARRSVRAPLILSLAAVAFVIAGAWVFRGARREAVPPPYRLRQMTREEGFSTTPALSPDGRLLAYASDRGGENNLDIWVQQVAGGDAIRLTRNPADDFRPSFSPDASQIVFERRGDGIYLAPSLGGAERLLVKGGSRPDYSPDGKSIAYSTGYPGSREGYGLFIVPLTAGAPRKLETGLAGLCCPVWSPDAKRLLVMGAATGIGWDPNDWFILPVAGGKAVKISVQTSLRRAGLTDFTPPVAWLANRDMLLFGAAQITAGQAGMQSGLSSAGGGVYNIWQVSIDPATGAFHDGPQRLTAGAGEFPGTASLDGRIPFSTESGGMTMYVLPLDVRQGKVTGGVSRIGRGGASERYPTLTSDGRKMVFVSDRAGTNDIWIKDLTTGEENVLIGTPENEGRGVISPDGSQVAFQRLENGSQVNYVWPLPAGPEKKLCDGCRSLLNWTSDSKSVIISEGDPERLLALDVNTGRRMLVASHPRYAIHDGCMSPDMRWITFKLIRSSTLQPVYVAPVRNGAAVGEQDWISIASGLTYKPFWSPDGNLLYYFSEQDNFACIYARRLDAATKQPQGEPFAVQHFHGDQRLANGAAVGYGLGPDQLYLPLLREKGNIWLAEPEKAQ